MNNPIIHQQRYGHTVIGTLENLRTQLTGVQPFQERQRQEVLSAITLILEDYDNMTDKLHRRNMQIKELQKKLKTREREVIDLCDRLNEGELPKGFTY